MKKKPISLIMAICLLTVTTAVWALTSQTNNGGTTSGFITEYAIPTLNSNPQHLAIEAAGPPARLWFTMMGADAIGNLVVTSTVDFQFTTYPVSAGSEPYDIAYDDSAGVVWFTQPGNNSIGQLDVATALITETAVPNNHTPWGIDVAPDGTVWFTEPAANQVVRYDPVSQTFTNFPYDFADGEPDQIEVLNNNSVWLTVPGVNRVAELEVGGAEYLNIPVGDFGSPTFPPGGLALDDSGPWITAPTMDRIGRYAKGTTAFWLWYSLPLTADNLDYSEANGTKELWFTNTAAGKVGLLLIDNQGEQVSLGTYPLPTPNSGPVDIVIADNGVAWITESNGNNIASWQPPYFYKTFLPFIRKNPETALQAPIFGLQLYGSTAENSPYHSYMLETNARWLRVPVSWSSAEPNDMTPAVYNWSSADNSLAAARADGAGMEIIATIDLAPAWVTSEGRGPIPTQYLDDFADFVGALVERFDGDGLDDAPGSPVVLYWEFYNEPDNNSDIQGNPNYTPPTHWGDHGAEYANMLTAVYPAVKAANPQAKVVFGGIALDWFESEGGPFVESFLDDVLAAGGGDYFDVMNFHSYPIFHARWTGNQGPGLLGKAEFVRNVLANYGLEKALIVTEAGWMSNESPGSPIPGSPEAQSRYVVELFTESMAADLDVMIWWLLVDSPFPYPFKNGLITNDPVPVRKMSFYVYQDMVAQLGTAQFVRSLSDTETGHALMQAFEFNDTVQNQTLYVAWLNPVATTETASLQLPAAQAYVHDSLTGFTIFLLDGDDGVTDGQITVQVGANPVYVEIDNVAE